MSSSTTMPDTSAHFQKFREQYMNTRRSHKDLLMLQSATPAPLQHSPPELAQRTRRLVSGRGAEARLLSEDHLAEQGGRPAHVGERGERTDSRGHQADRVDSRGHVVDRGGRAASASRDPPPDYYEEVTRRRASSSSPRGPQNTLPDPFATPPATGRELRVEAAQQAQPHAPRPAERVPPVPFFAGGGGQPVAQLPRSPERSMKAVRFAEPMKFIPVLFLSSTIFMLYLIYVLNHGLELLQLDVPKQHLDLEMRYQGIVDLSIFHYLTLLLVICYVRSILTAPGGIPENDPRWDYIQDVEQPGTAELPAEAKKSGQRRHCKWCAKYKPDRTHHCRICRTCVLKMDHHCPWIYNCVGFKNHKFFWLFLFYGVLDTNFMTWTMMDSLIRSIYDDAPFMTMFFHLFGVNLAGLIACVLLVYFGVHCWLMFSALTTIEFCEKSSQVTGSNKKSGSKYVSIYSQGIYANICAVLGDNMLLWFLPLNRASGDGLSYPVNRSLT